MIQNIIVGAAVLWAAAYTGLKTYRFFKGFSGNEYFKCSCSSCPYTKNK